MGKFTSERVDIQTITQLQKDFKEITTAADNNIEKLKRRFYR